MSRRLPVRVPLLFLVAAVSLASAAADWPVLRTYEGECLRRVKMPLGGIGTGTISLTGKGSLVDWELLSRPSKGHIPAGDRNWKWRSHFAFRAEDADGKKVARILEGPLYPEDFEGAFGCPCLNSGFPRFERAVFKAAYPLAQVELTDPKVPVEVTLEAMNPLVRGDEEASGIPAILLRWRLKNRTTRPVKASIAATLPECIGVEFALETTADPASITSTTNVTCPGWNVALDRYWRRFLAEGVVGDLPGEKERLTVLQKCVSTIVPASGETNVVYVLGWRNPKRMSWKRFEEKFTPRDEGNWYATRFPTAAAAAQHLLKNLPELERQTIDFVKSIMAAKAPAVVKEAALFNLSTLRCETCHRTRDGNFFGWEGCADGEGSCYGSCTHVWGYEHALVDLWPNLARSMLDLQFGPSLGPDGHMVFRIVQPVDTAARARGLAAADGQMQSIVKALEYRRRTGDVAWLKKTWPRIRLALSFCWVKGGWDADRDGVMEGCQHNTMDVEYFGPNPQMEFLYLAALSAAEEMAKECGDDAFAKECRALRERGSAWTEKNLFNGEYYEHKIWPVKSAADIAPGLRHEKMGARNLADPDFQLGAGCLIDQLLGDFSAWSAGLGFVADRAHAKTTLKTILARCRKPADDDTFNPMRDFALRGETSIRMAWYPEGRLPRSPFPYYQETMTGFEYVVAALMAVNGDQAEAERIVRDIRDRYDGKKRNPFDEAECGHHYARALAAWSVLRAFEQAAK